MKTFSNGENILSNFFVFKCNFLHTVKANFKLMTLSLIEKKLNMNNNDITVYQK